MRQGTILNPICLLFILMTYQIYVSSLLTSTCLQTTLSYISIITGDDHQVLQKGLNTFQEWSDRSLLRLNINKCNIAFYGRDVNYEYKYYLLSTVLESVDVVLKRPGCGI